jgi:hypothetical protein
LHPQLCRLPELLLQQAEREKGAIGIFLGNVQLIFVNINGVNNLITLDGKEVFHVR